MTLNLLQEGEVAAIRRVGMSDPAYPKAEISP